MSAAEGMRYKTPEAARRAVTDKLRAEAAKGTWPLDDLQRQYAYDQLVERLYRLDDRWVIKGATALLARRISVRHYRHRRVPGWRDRRGRAPAA